MAGQVSSAKRECSRLERDLEEGSRRLAMAHTEIRHLTDELESAHLTQRAYGERGVTAICLTGGFKLSRSLVVVIQPMEFQSSCVTFRIHEVDVFEKCSEGPVSGLAMTRLSPPTATVLLFA